MSTAITDPTASDTPLRDPQPRPIAPSLGFRLLKPLASLQLTVILFAMSMILVFFGTVAQKNAGIWTVVDQYFWSWIVWIDLQLVVEFGKVFLGIAPETQAASWMKVPFPAGKLLGGLMFLNLLAAHIVRFQFTWKRSGIIILHAGMMLLFVGELITREFQVEQQMTIEEGNSTNYAVDTRHCELAFLSADESAPNKEKVTVVPAQMLREALKQQSRIRHDDLPVDLEVKAYYLNSVLAPAKANQENLATAGGGVRTIAVEQPEVSGVDPNQKVDTPSAYVTLYKKNSEESLGTYLVTTRSDVTQPILVDGKKYEILLRFKHLYKPYSIELKDFRFDRYIGTNTPKNYSSDVVILDSENGKEFEYTIAMNKPLYYRGETFYQSSFTPDEKATILQVVRNPGWMIPYISCVMVSLGMLLHFGLNLGAFLNRVRRPRIETKLATPQGTNSSAEWVIPTISTVLVGLYLVSAIIPRGTGSKFDLNEAARLPVIKDGRIKPLDTVARVDLRIITHREEFTDDKGRKQPAIKWFFDTHSFLSRGEPISSNYRIFRIDNEDLLKFLKLEPREGFRYSIDEIRPRWEAFNEAAKKIDEIPSNKHDLFQAKLIELRRHIEIFLGVWLGHGRDFPLLLPEYGDFKWRTPGSVREAINERLAMLKMFQLKQWGVQDVQDLPKEQQDEFNEMMEAARKHLTSTDPVYQDWLQLLTAYQKGDTEGFNRRLYEFRDKYFEGVSSADKTRVKFEVFLNEFAPFYHCTALYVIAFLLASAAWGAAVFGASEGGEGFRRAAFRVLFLTFLVHTFALISRMYLMDRPLVFVTNLYSSAIFIGWAATGICLIVERWFPMSIGSAVGAALGFLTCVIAHNLAVSGDTLEMMQAVLDSNFWLASHVTTVTLGYSATYIAGTFGLAYLLLYLFTNVLSRESTLQVDAQGRGKEIGKILAQLMYGIICLATLLSFVGTVLGGIWADYSWGRFWGWDPKENGAVLIVIWNALILHARWCGLVKDRGVAALAVVGNMVTTWSWFGTNQLGVGLHAYGFNNQLVRLCVAVWVSHLAVLALLCVPQSWMSRIGDRVRPALAHLVGR